MRLRALEAFLCGITVGIGMTILTLYAQKPRCWVSSIEGIAEMGRTRKSKEEENRLRRLRLKTEGFSDEEIEEIFH